MRIMVCFQSMMSLTNRMPMSTVFITQINYRLNICGSIERTPPGYLFLCPLADLRSDTPTSLRVPDCPAYWSLDPSGVEHLTTEEAQALGLPIIVVEMEVIGDSWDGSVYAGLRQFHQGKGFDPDTQDLARHLGYPLFWVSSDLDAPFTQGKSQ